LPYMTMFSREVFLPFLAFASRSAFGQTCDNDASITLSDAIQNTGTCETYFNQLVIPKGGVLVTLGNTQPTKMFDGFEGYCLCPGEEDLTDFRLKDGTPSDINAPSPGTVSNPNIKVSGAWPQCMTPGEKSGRSPSDFSLNDFQDTCGIYDCLAGGTTASDCFGPDLRSYNQPSSWTWRATNAFCSQGGTSASGLDAVNLTSPTEVITNGINSRSRGCGMNQALLFTNIPCSFVDPAKDFCPEAISPTPAPTLAPSRITEAPSQSPTTLDICTDSPDFEGFYYTNPGESSPCWVYKVVDQPFSTCYDSVDEVATAFEEALAVTSAPTSAPSLAPEDGEDCEQCSEDGVQNCKPTCTSTQTIPPEGRLLVQGKNPLFQPSIIDFSDLDNWVPNSNGIYSCVCQGGDHINSLGSAQVSTKMVTKEFSNSGWGDSMNPTIINDRKSFLPVCYDTSIEDLKRTIPLDSTDKCGIRECVNSATDTDDCMLGPDVPPQLDPATGITYNQAYQMCTNFESYKSMINQTSQSVGMGTGCKSNKNMFWTNIPCPLALRCS